MKTWTTKQGETLIISEMKTSHIENCIKMLNKNIIGIEFFGDEDYCNLKEELEHRNRIKLVLKELQEKEE